MRDTQNNNKTSFYNDPTIDLVNPAAWDEQKSFVNELAGFIRQTLAALGIEVENIKIDRTTEAGFGDFSSNIAMQLAKSLGRNPRELAAEIIAELQKKYRI